MGEGLDFTCLQEMASHWDYYPTTHPEQTLQRVQDADLIISNKVVLDKTILSACHNLKLVCIAATGTNNIDLQAAKQAGVVVSNVTAYGTASVVQHVFAMLLSLTNRLFEYQQAAIDGSWQQSANFCVLDQNFHELAGKTMGIIGHGELGRGVAKTAQAFGMNVNFSERPGGGSQPGRLPLSQILTDSDVITLHVPLAENTKNLIGQKELGLMKPGAILINTARGGIVDEQALVEALDSGKIAAAAVDVLTEEPPRSGNVLLQRQRPNLIVTPHIAWAAVESRQRLLNQMADNIRAYERGKPRNQVNI